MTVILIPPLNFVCLFFTSNKQNTIFLVNPFSTYVCKLIWKAPVCYKDYGNNI